MNSALLSVVNILAFCYSTIRWIVQLIMFRVIVQLLRQAVDSYKVGEYSRELQGLACSGRELDNHDIFKNRKEGK